MGKKRGQATIFIILGLVIVIFVIILFYLKQDTIREKIGQLSFRSTVVPERVQTVVFYVDGCLENLAKEGIDVIGRKGGYIILSNSIEFNPNRYLQVDEFTKNPYWLNRYGQNIPTATSMEGQIKNYIDENFNSRCNLNSFEAINYKFDMDDPDVSVSINKDNVVINLNSKFDTKIGEEVFSLKNYVTGKIDAKLGQSIDIGKKIVDEELQDGALEFNTINLIAAYSHDGSSGIPPMSGLDFDCTKKVWVEPTVENKLKEMLTENLIYLNVPGAGSAYTRGKDKFYGNMEWDIDGNLDNFDINFYYYPEWGMDLDVYPKNRGLIESSNLGLTTWLMTFCMNMYNFRYDIRYPILVEIVDKENDYTFQFPIEVDVVDNYKRERLFSIEQDTQSISLFCDPNQRNSGIVDMAVFDGFKGDLLEGAEVSYECGLDICSIGKTNSQGKLRENFPTCYNGVINLYKEGYATERKLLTTEDDKGYNLDLVLEPLRMKSVRGEVMVDGLRRALNDDESLLVEFNRINLELNDYDYSFAAQIDKNGGEIEIVPGLYDVSLVLFTNKKITLPAEKFSYTTIWPFHKTVEIPEQSFDGLMLGKNNFEWNVDKDDLDGFNQIAFIVKGNNLPRKYSDLETLYKEEEEEGISPEYES